MAGEEGEMKKRTAIAAVLAGAVVIVLGCFYVQFHFSRASAFWHTQSTDLTFVRPGGYYLGESLDDKAFQGKAMTPIVNALYDYEKLDQGLTIAADENRKLVRIILDSSELDIGKGIRAGSKVTDAMQAFGQSYYKRRDEQSGEPVTGYVDRKNDMTIEFWSDQGVITEIRMDRTFVQ